MAASGALLLVALVAAVMPRGRAPSPGPTGVSPSSSASGPVASQEPDVADPAWWRIDGDFTVPRGDRTLLFGTVGLGQVGERLLRDDLAALEEGRLPRTARVTGPVAGTMLLIEDVGGQSVLTALDAGSGDETELVRGNELIFDAALLGAGVVVFLTADHRDGAPTGLWRTTTAGDTEPEAIPDVLATLPDVQLVAVVEWITELIVSPDRTSLAVYRCVRLSCELRGVDLATMETWQLDLEWGAQPAAIVNGVIVLTHACVDVDCIVELLDVWTGVRRPAPMSEARPVFEVAVIGRPDPVIVTPLSGDRAPREGPIQDPVEVEVLDLHTMGVRTLPVALKSLVIVEASNWGVGIELPPGSFLVQGSPIRGGDEAPRSAYFIVDVASGRVVSVPALGEVFIQG